MNDKTQSGRGQNVVHRGYERQNTEWPGSKCRSSTYEQKFYSYTVPPNLYLKKSGKKEKLADITNRLLNLIKRYEYVLFT